MIWEATTLIWRHCILPGAVAAGVSIAQQSGLIVASFVMTLNYMTSTLIVGTALIVLALAIAGYVPNWKAEYSETCL